MNTITGYSGRSLGFYGLDRSKVVAGAPCAEEAMKLAELNWEVGIEPMYQTRLDGSVVPVPDRYLTVRSDNEFVLGSVGKQYSVFQNAEAFEFADALLGYGIEYDAAGSWDEGRKVFLTAKLPEGITVEGDSSGGAIDMYLLFRTSHDGSGAVTAMITPVRISCTNMLNLATKSAVSKWTARHTSSVGERTKQAGETLGIIDAYRTEFASMAQELLSIEMGLAEFTDFVKEVVPAERIQAGMVETWATSPTVDRRTGWGAINAVGEHMEWNRGGRGSIESRFDSNIDGQTSNVRNRAVGLLLRRTR